MQPITADIYAEKPAGQTACGRQRQEENHMRRRVTAILLAGLFAAASLTGCGSSSADAEEKGADTAKAADAQDTADTAGDSSSGELETITVGAVPTPHAEILNYVKDDLKEKGYDLKVVEFDDYVLPNKALSDGPAAEDRNGSLFQLFICKHISPPSVF